MDSIQFTEETLVVDSGSQDKTLSLAKEMGANTISQNWLGYGEQRNFGTFKAKNDWILFVDSDEWFGPEICQEIVNKWTEIENSDGVYLPRNTLFQGKAFKFYRPFFREMKLRLFNRTRGKWSEPKIHENVFVEGKTLKLKEVFYHEPFDNFEHAKTKFKKYLNLKKSGKNSSVVFFRTLISPVLFPLFFLREYFLRLGFLDGKNGLLFSYLYARYLSWGL